MRIKFLQSVAGIGFAYRHSEVVSLPRKDAQVFIKAGLAEELETATAEPATEKAVRRGKK